MAKNKRTKQQDDAVADVEARREQALEELNARFDREAALAGGGPQPVTDGNEVSALETITGQKPERDLSNAPPPEPLGPLHMTEDGDLVRADEAELTDGV